jgi:DNA repair photolyase
MEEPRLKQKRKITSGTKEWADHNVNCIKGCANDCKYCYAKMMGKRFGRCTEETWNKMEINEAAVKKNYRKYDGRVMFPSSHDIVDEPKIIDACFKVLKKLLEADNEVLVTSKPDLHVTEEIINQFSEYHDQIQFRFTITSINNRLLSFWEPNAPRYEERKESLILAFKEGYKTSVSIEPFLDKDPINLIYELDPYVTESIWVGPMNYIPRKNIPEEDEPQYIRIRENIEAQNLKKIYNELKDMEKIRFKDSFLNKLNL